MERRNVLAEGNSDNFVHSIVCAVAKGHSDNIIAEDVVELVKQNSVSNGIVSAAPEALRSYAKSISDSLNNIANKIENKKADGDEIEDEECGECETCTCGDEPEDDDEKATMVIITEDYDKSGYVEKENKLAGTLIVDFNQDMGIYKKGCRVVLGTSCVNYLKSRLVGYFKKEYPQMKAKLSDNIFKSNVVFTDVKKGKAKIEYEIAGAF